MQWDYPWVLAGLLAVPGLAYLFAVQWRQKTAFREAWSQLAYTRAHSTPPAAARHYVSTTLFLLGFALSVVGFASPMLQRTAWEPFWENVALVVMMDFSRSMEAPRDPDELNAPSRFVETRQNILGFLSSLPPGVKVSFVPFSEYAIPITSGFSDDHGELVAKVRRLQRDFFFKQGTDLALALQEGFNLADAFRRLQADSGNGAGRQPVTSIILISDGDEPVNDDLRKTVNERNGSPVPVFTIGIGSAVPAYIPGRRITGRLSARRPAAARHHRPQHGNPALHRRQDRRCLPHLRRTRRAGSGAAGHHSGAGRAQPAAVHVPVSAAGVPVFRGVRGAGGGVAGRRMAAVGRAEHPPAGLRRRRTTGRSGVG